jgi:hypothetical protein
MRRQLWLAVLSAGVLFSVSACAVLEETRERGAHFASWRHMTYSLFRGTPEETSEADVRAAQRENWWGEVIRVEPDQLSSASQLQTSWPRAD